MTLVAGEHESPDQIRRLRVLLAEDDDAMRGFVADSLRRDGYEVVEARDGSELRAWIQRLAESGDNCGLDVIVSDIHMPGKTALEVVGECRQVTSRIPIVLVTAFGSEENHEKALALGAAAILDKPFDLSSLKDVLHGLVGNPVSWTG